MTEEFGDMEDDFGEPIHVHPACGWGCLVALLAILLFLRCL